MTILHKGLENSNRGKVQRQTTCLILIWVSWKEGNIRIFYDKMRTSNACWVIIDFLPPFGPLLTQFLRAFPSIGSA